MSAARCRRAWKGPIGAPNCLRVKRSSRVIAARRKVARQVLRKKFPHFLPERLVGGVEPEIHPSLTRTSWLRRFDARLRVPLGAVATAADIAAALDIRILYAVHSFTILDNTRVRLRAPVELEGD